MGGMTSQPRSGCAGGVFAWLSNHSLPRNVVARPETRQKVSRHKEALCFVSGYVPSQSLSLWHYRRFQRLTQALRDKTYTFHSLS
jgi:hypothetical protein